MQTLAFCTRGGAELLPILWRGHFIARLARFAPPASVFRPASLRRASKDLAAFFRADIPPSRRAQADGGALDRRRRELAAREIEDLDGQVEQRLRWKTRLAHDAPESRGPARTEHSREFRSQNIDGGIAC